jgi:hypothetical protein
MSKLGMHVANRVEALRVARPQFDGETVGVLDEYQWQGEMVVMGWQELAHGARSITANDRLGTAKFEEECDVLLKLVRTRPELVSHEAKVDDLRRAIGEGSRLPFTRPMYKVVPRTFGAHWHDADGPIERP